MSDDHWRNQPGDVQAADSSSYWQGAYHGPDYDWRESDAAARYHGSMSSAARRAYANEAIRQKDHVSAGLLAVFLGMFGVHKFYLGCNNAGFIMLAVSIIGGIFTFGDLSFSC